MKESVVLDPLLFRDAGWQNGTRWFTLIHYLRISTSYGVVTIPTGFMTDGASIPKVFHNLLGPTGPGWFEAGVLHDFLYSKQSDRHFKVDRATADMLFKEVMFNLGVPWHKREMIYRAVRMFGWRSWKKR